MLYSFFRVIPRRLNFTFRHVHRLFKRSMKMHRKFRSPKGENTTWLRVILLLPLQIYNLDLSCCPQTHPQNYQGHTRSFKEKQEHPCRKTRRLHNRSVEHETPISIVKQTRCTNVSNYLFFGITLHVSDGLSTHHQEFTTVHAATGICQTDTATTCLLASRQQYLFDIACCCMYSSELLMVNGKTIRNM